MINLKLDAKKSVYELTWDPQEEDIKMLWNFLWQSIINLWVALWWEQKDLIDFYDFIVKEIKSSAVKWLQSNGALEKWEMRMSDLI